MDAHERAKHSWEDWDQDDIDLELAPWPKPVAEEGRLSPEDAAIDAVDSRRSLDAVFASVLKPLTDAERAYLERRFKDEPSVLDRIKRTK